MEGVLCQLDMDPWGTPYRTTISKIARKVSTVGLHVNNIQKIVSELFELRPTEQIREANDGHNGENGVNNIIVPRSTPPTSRCITKSSRRSINSNELLSSRRKSYTCWFASTLVRGVKLSYRNSCAYTMPSNQEVCLKQLRKKRERFTKELANF